MSRQTYLILIALLAGCGLPAEPPTQSAAEFRDRVRENRQQKPSERPQGPVETPDAPTPHKADDRPSVAVSLPVVTVDRRDDDCDD